MINTIGGPEHADHEDCNRQVEGPKIGDLVVADHVGDRMLGGIRAKLRAATTVPVAQTQVTSWRRANHD